MYYVKRKTKRYKCVGMGEITGILTKTRSGKGAIKVKKMIICDKAMKNAYSKKQMDKKFSELYNFIYKFLTSEDNSEEGIKACLGEIEKIKSALFNKYKENLKNKQYKEYLTKIVLTENEFRNKYFEREFYANLIRNTMKRMEAPNYNEEVEKGRSR